MKEKTIYIVAGDEMQILFKNKYPSIKTIAFCENFSKGNCNCFSFNNKLIEERSLYWNVSKEEYVKKMHPIINLDLRENYILCFGNDDCCKANLKFLIGFLKEKKYSKRIHIQIVNEYNLDIVDEYYL